MSRMMAPGKWACRHQVLQPTRSVGARSLAQTARQPCWLAITGAMLIRGLLARHSQCHLAVRLPHCVLSTGTVLPVLIVLLRILIPAMRARTGMWKYRSEERRVGKECR